MSKTSDTKTSQNTTTNLTQTPTNPDWATSGIQGLAGTLTGLGQADPSSFVAPTNSLLTGAGTAAGGLTMPDGFTNAQAIFNGVAAPGASTYSPTMASAASLLPNLQSYMSPYTNNVVDSALKDYDFGAGQTQAQNQLSLANDDTFGGSGGAIQTAMSNDAINRGRATLSSGLRDQAFQVGAGLANDDANRQQETSLANAGASNTAGQFDAAQQEAALQRMLEAGNSEASTAQAQNTAANTNINTQSSIGQLLQQLAQNRAAAPLSTAGALTSMWGGLPLNLFHGTNSDGTSATTGTSSTTTTDPMGSLGSLVSAGGSLASGLGAMGLMFSDARLKRDAVKVGERGGLSWYLFRYLWSPVLHLGVMAQEVLTVKPDAVVAHSSGYLAVDYGRI